MAANDLSVSYDPGPRLIRLVGRGLWTTEGVVVFERELERTFARARADQPHLLMLADLRESRIQTQEAMDTVAAFGQRTYRPGDRIAVVVSSSLAKMQMRRLKSAATMEVFLSPNAAMRWLMAHHPDTRMGIELAAAERPAPAADPRLMAPTPIGPRMPQGVQTRY